MDHPAFIVYSFMENSIGLKWWNNLNYWPDSHNFMASQTFSGSSPEVNSFTTSPAKLRHWKIVIWVSIDSFNVIVFIRAYQPIDNNFDIIFIMVGTKLTVPYNVHWAETRFTWEKSILNDILASCYDLEVSNIDLQCSSFDGHLLQSFGP